MKLILILIAVGSLAVSAKTCKKKEEKLMAGCYKGRLEIKAACMNYTISITAGKFDTALVVPQWTDENTGKTYKNAFALGSRCSFPTNINAGDEFYFTLDSGTVQNCAVCMMYYPVPPKHLSIKVLDQPCTAK